MKFELEPENRNCPDDELLADLSSVAQRLENSSLTKEEYNLHGRFCAATMQNRFSSWNNALTRSGLSIGKRVDIPKDELVVDLRKIAADLGSQTVTREQYRLHGSFSDETMSRRFGSWAAALAKAELQPTGWKPQATEEDLFDNMAVVWERIGRQPKQKDLRPPLSRFSAATYVNRYGSWRCSLEAFVAAMGSDDSESSSEITPSQMVAPSTPRSVHTHRTSRNPSWRMRFLVMRCDSFACRLCGASPAKDPAVSLHVDHIHPWSKGGETMMSNLQTCCEVCNGGKSNLLMETESG